MFQNYFILFFRNIKRDKHSFFINLIGLSTGLACALLIYLWVNDELHIDKFQGKGSHIYQVMQNSPSANGIVTFEPTPGLLAKTMMEEMPEIEYATSVVPASWFDQKGILSVGKNSLKTDGQFVGNDFFKIFPFKLIMGDSNRILADDHAVLLSDEMAMKLFNTTNVIGKSVEWAQEDFNDTYMVSGVFKTPPANSTAQFDLLLSYGLFLKKFPKLQNWSNSDPDTYIALKKGTDIKQFNAKIANYLKSKDKNSNVTLFVRRYSDKYLYGKYENGIQSGGRIGYVKLFSLIAIFVLFIACINYMNLSTAKASRRMKEIGIKKAIGSNRKTLIGQYLSESILIAFLSLMCAGILVALFLPQFNMITGKKLYLALNMDLVFPVLGITLFAGLVAGSYPAFYLSGFKPIDVLKSKLHTSPGELWVRKGLVIFQFSLSVVFIVGLLILTKQVEYTQTKNLGYNRNNVIYFSMQEKAINNSGDDGTAGKPEKETATVLSRIKSTPGVVNASTFWQSIVAQHGSTSGVSWDGQNEGDKLNFACLNVDYDFIETLGINIRDGRAFSREFGTDDSAIVFNETAIKSMGLTDPVGKTVKLWGKDRQIVGVVKDFNFESLHNKIGPLFLILEPQLNNFIVKISSAVPLETIDRLRGIYKEYNPEIPFEFTFLDTDYQVLYQSERKITTLSKYFAGIAIIISCLGMFGLAAYTAERRRKEIGVRKVFGSSQLSIFYLLSGDFTKQVLVSIVIALPISYLIAKHWLNSFAYRINLEWWLFLGAGLIALFIAWLTVGTQAVKAANTSPSQCLKEE
jgi:putative ABC transport system permease protein